MFKKCYNMAGSPVFKIKPSSGKKPKLQRKLSLPNANENPSKHLLPSHTIESQSDSLDQCSEIKNESSGIQDVTNRNEPNKSICSSLSSFVFPSKKCAKRKLNFDVDGDNDDVSSLRFSDKNLSLCGFRSKTSSIADQRSLPDIRNTVQSPNKNRTRFSGSYRSSVGSTISCRRKLFTEFEEAAIKKPRLTSPVLCQKTKSNKKEIKLSLKKKFPGVPNSDSARSGLLLNLAFSKYNLSSSKKEDVSVDFVDNSSCTATKKDFVQYSQIKQDDSLRCRSPVFMAIKKVKRKLNLEDQSTLVSNISVGNGSDDLKINTSKDEHPASKPMPEKLNPPNTDTNYEPSKPLKLDNNNDSLECNPKSKNCALPITFTESSREISNFKRQEISAKISTPFSPVIMKQTSTSDNHSSSREKLQIARCKNNLFKNSKIRSTLRDKIFDLSEVKSNCDRKVDDNAGNKSLFDTENSLCRKNVPRINNSGNNNQSSLLTKNNSSRNATTNSNETHLIRGHQSSNKGCKTVNLQHSEKPKKWINRDSFTRNSSANHRLKTISSTSCDQKFLKSHMNRFLADCLNFTAQKNDSDNENFSDDITTENRIIDDDDNSSDERMDCAIENIDSQKVTENTDSRSKKNENHLKIDKKDSNVTTVDQMETGNCQEKIAKDVCIDSTTFDGEKTDETIGNDDSLKKIDVSNSEIKTGKNKLIIDERSPENKQACCAIEDVNSQDDVLIENIDSQCEQVIIEPIESQNEIGNHIIDVLQTDVNSLLLESQSYSMSIPLKDCILKRNAKVCESVNTETITPPPLNKVAISQVDRCGSRENELKSAMNVSVFDSYEQIEEVSTSASYSCVQFTDKNEESLTPNRENMTADYSDLLDTAKKTKKKSIPNSLAQRLDKLLGREKSDFRMWEYEMSKTKAESISHRKPAVFCIEKMWTEYSHLILLCSYFQKNVSGETNFKFDELKSFAKDISNSVVIILEQEWCPKNLTYSTVFRIDPPWKLLNFEKCSPLLMLKPHKISVISTDENPVLYKDPTIPNTFIVTRQRELCSCGDHICNCGLPDCYQFLVEPLLLPDVNSFSRKKISYHHFDIDTFNCRRIDDVLMKHKLFAFKDLSLDVQVLHSHKDESVLEFSFWYFVCLDEQKNICCVLAENKTDDILPYVNKEIILKFTGISPFKMIPSKNVMIFLQYINFTNVPDDVKNVIDSQSVVVFLLSNEHGNVECVDSSF